MRAVLRAFVFGFLRLRIVGEGGLRRPGPLLLVGNHPTIVDGLVLALLAPRKVRFVAAPELLKVPGLGRLLAWLGAIPAGERAVEAAVAALDQGDLVAIFPEGRTNGGRELLPFRSGAERIAALSGAPVVAFGLDGTQRVYPEGARVARPARVAVAFGPRLHRPDGLSLRTAVHQAWRSAQTVSAPDPGPLEAVGWGLRALPAAALLIPFSLGVTGLHRCAPARRLQARMRDR